MNIVIGIPISEKKSYIFDKFINNQIKIKQKTPIQTQIIFSTEDSKFADKINILLTNSELDYKIVVFAIDPEKSDRLTKITQAREAIRIEFLKTNSEYLAFFDSDMLFNPNILNILYSKIDKFDVVYNSYLVHNNKICNNGLGTCLIKRQVLSKIKFRSLTLYKYGAYIDEGFYFELDCLHLGYKILEGAFASSCHYSNPTDFNRLEPCEKGRWEKIVHSRLARYILSMFVDIKPIMSLISIISVKLYNHL
jgi:hypothetical protein